MDKRASSAAPTFSGTKTDLERTLRATRNEPSGMEWSEYKQGKLARCEHGHYFVYKKSRDEQSPERWYAEYEPGTGDFTGHGRVTGNIQGFETLEEAKRECEENALAMTKALEH